MSQPSWIGYSLNNRYKIKELVGKGGMSTVYKATDPNLRRDVAVKLIHSHLTDDPEFVRRFEEEAAAVARLNHPNIIHVYDFNKDGDVYYMILELLAGETLQTRLKRLSASKRRMPVDDAIRVTLGMCDALAYAHSQGMVHRDIKPANIMLTTQGRTILMDFGVVKMLDTQAHTSTGAVIGTALYMSPEQARGERPDARADIYSLGVTLFEMVSGRPPFEADSTMATMRMHVNDPVPDIRDLAPGTPPALKSIIEKALEKNRDKRYQSMAQMATDLRNLLSDMGVSVPASAVSEVGESPQMATVVDTQESRGTERQSRAKSTVASGGGGGRSWLMIGGGIAVGVAAGVALVVFVILPGLRGAAQQSGGTEVSDEAMATEESGGSTGTVDATESAAPTETTEPIQMTLAQWLQENTEIVVEIDEAAGTVSIRAEGMPNALPLPLNPELGGEATSIMQGGPIGVAIDGLAIYSAYNREGAIRPANEADQCGIARDPIQNFSHYLLFPLTPSCLEVGATGDHPVLFGIAFDGFGIYGPYGQGNEPPLDECQGHTHPTPQNPGGDGTYHYHARTVAPYILGCLMGENPYRPPEPPQ